jgi:DNA modification methylase
MIYTGDCLDVLRTLPADSVDAIVTDPPYGLAFMGKKWDYDVPSEEIWRECLRVLKPGGHLLAFAGTRTQHRMAVRIEDAGFEIRDLIAWVYGSGFPKSLDVSKAIDKAAGRIGESVVAIKREIRKRYESQGMTQAAFNFACGFEASGYLRESSTWASVLPPADKWQAIKAVLGCGDDLDALFVEAEREVVGRTNRGNAVNTAFMSGGNDVTAPATDAARQWAGWGTALKPALEPITVARKPLIGTVAENVLAHGTGALNVDKCRVGTDGGTAKGSKPMGEGNGIYGAGLHGACEIPQLSAGRWPANLIHDGSDEVVGLFPVTGASKAAPRGGTNPNPMDWGNGRTDGDIVKGHTDNGGSAARFFYCAKASKRDRDEGNNHPTVKPTDLMRYLCRLVTPPGGTVLDPFMGSGSTGKAAMLEGFDFIGIERDPEYVKIAEARINEAKRLI